MDPTLFTEYVNWQDRRNWFSEAKKKKMCLLSSDRLYFLTPTQFFFIGKFKNFQKIRLPQEPNLLLHVFNL
jgi:hypothetical protein